MNSSHISWVLMILLGVSSSLSHSVGVNIPSLATVVTKTVGGLAAFQTMVFLDSIKESKRFRSVSKLEVNPLSSPVPLAPAPAIMEPEQPIFALIATGIAFFGVIAWNIKNSKKIQQQGLTDKQAIEVEKA